MSSARVSATRVDRIDALANCPMMRAGTRRCWSMTKVVGVAWIGVTCANASLTRPSFTSITLWCPKDRWPLVNGCFLAMGGLGAISATAPLEAVLEFTDWRGVFLALAAVTVVVAAIIRVAVPERLSVVGYDSSAVALTVRPHLTSVNQPRQEMGRIAARMLQERREGRRTDSRSIAEPVLRIRDSTGPGPASP